jgi:predicted phosphate transport protein (TIGR00153 family)
VRALPASPAGTHPESEPRVPFSLTPKDSSFYPLFTASAENLVAATEVLGEFVHDHARRPELADQLRDLEHVGDQATHAIFRALNTSFVTPFDREDIYSLASNLDDVMDYVEAAADLVILTGLGTLPAEMSQQVALLQRCAQVTAEAMPRLKTLKDLSDYWIEVNRIENEADKLYRRLLSRLYSGEFDALEILKLKEVADQLEEAADAFEHLANVVETIAVKES